MSGVKRYYAEVLRPYWGEMSLGTAVILASDYDRDTQALRDDYNEACADAMQVAGKLQALEAERDALRAQVEAMRDALLSLLTLDIKGHHLLERLQFSTKGREILEKVNAALQAKP